MSSPIKNNKQNKNLISSSLSHFKQCSKSTNRPKKTGVSDEKLIDSLRPLIASHRAIYNKRAELVKKLQDAKILVGDYFVVDAKQSSTPSVSERELALLTAELQTAKSLVSNVLGDRALRLNLYQIYNLVCDGTGLVSAVGTVDPSPISEFASLADLFDEYRVYSYSYDFAFQNAGFISAGSSKSTTCAMGHDPSEIAAASGLVGVAQLGQHRLYALPCMTNTIGMGQVSTQLHRFDAHIPAGILLSNNTGGPASTSTWQATSLISGTYIPYGFIKINAQVFGLLSAPAISGMLTYHCGFRCRT